MQDIHSGRLFGGGDRRIRAHHHLHHPGNHGQALKCPRCDSPNTKFCYYNNYNLSQPRHFCKSCRRYWTKGGVLRNVPVGGGCRKAKRAAAGGAGSKSKKASPEAEAEAAAAAAAGKTPPPPPKPARDDVASGSSSDSSNLTGITVCSVSASASAPGSAYVSGPASASASAPAAEPASFLSTSKMYGYGWGLLDQGLFPEIGSFTNLIASPPGSETTAFSCAAEQQWTEKEEKVQGLAGGLLGETGQVEFFQGRSEGGGFGLLDWPGGGDQSLFDLPNAIDQAYWSQTPWTAHDQPGLHLP